MDVPWSVLLVGSAEEQARLVVLLESEGLVCRLERVSDRDALTRALAQPWAVVLASERLEALGVDKVIELVKAQCPSLEVVVLAENPRAATEWLPLGARDVVSRTEWELLPVLIRRLGREAGEHQRLEDRLRQSEQLETVGLLAGGIAHDFNNVMTGVFGFIQLARMNPGQAEQVAEYLDLALGPFQKARALTQQLMALSRSAEPPRASVAVVQWLPQALKAVLGDSGVVWRLETPAAPWSALANEPQLRQVFENLILNAKQAFGCSQGTLAVTVKNVASPGPENRGLPPADYLEIELQDNGSGMSPEVLAKATDPFFTTKPQRAGLGLALCSSIVKKHGGALELESWPEQGTLARVFWPAATPEPETSK